MHALILLGCLFAGRDSGDPAPRGTTGKADSLVQQRFSAGIEITLDREKLAASGLAAGDAASAVRAFFKTHRSFKLSELQALKLESADGKTHQLKELATIEVDFQSMDGSKPK